MARAHTTEAIDALVANLRDENGSVRNMAAVALLDRGWGRPVQPIAGSDDHPPIGFPMQSLDLAGLTNEQLSGLRALFARVVAVGDGASPRSGTWAPRRR